MKTLAEMILRRDELANFFWDYLWVNKKKIEIETAYSHWDWIQTLVNREPHWQQEWQDVYMQLTGEHVQLWRELRELIETIARMEIEHAKHFQPNYPHGDCDGECCKSKM